MKKKEKNEKVEKIW